LAPNDGEDWASLVYESNASIYQPVLEAGLKTAPEEVGGIIRVFSSHGVGAGGSILDLACGIGRHTVHLAKAGYHVTGIDPSSTFLARARELVAEEGVSQNVNFARGRFSNFLEVMSRERLGKFNGIILMDSSIGVTGRDEDDRALFKDLMEAGAKSAVLIIEIFDRDYATQHFGRTLVEEFPNSLVRTWKRLSPLGSRVLEADWSFYRKQSDQSLKHLLTTRVRTRHYSVAELRVLAKKAGWKYLACYGSLKDLHRFTKNDFRAFLVFMR
jgi:SAM-dependent methyltransferase